MAMSDYIKREDAIAVINNYVGDDSPYAQWLVRKIGQIDDVPLVRCKDCKCWTEWANGTGSCSRFALDWLGTDADDVAQNIRVTAPHAHNWYGKKR